MLSLQQDCEANFFRFLKELKISMHVQQLFPWVQVDEPCKTSQLCLWLKIASSHRTRLNLRSPPSMIDPQLGVTSGIARVFQLQGHCGLHGLSRQKPPWRLSGSPVATEHQKLLAIEARNFWIFPLFCPFFLSFYHLFFSSFHFLFLFCLALCGTRNRAHDNKLW